MRLANHRSSKHAGQEWARFPLLEYLDAIDRSVFWMHQSSLGDRTSVSFIGILTVVAYQESHTSRGRCSICTKPAVSRWLETLRHAL